MSQIETRAESNGRIIDVQSPALTLTLAFCLVTFIASWSLWVLAATSFDSNLTVQVFGLVFNISRRTVYAMAGNVAPGFATLLIGLATRWRWFPSLAAQFRIHLSQIGMYVLAVLVPILIVIFTYITQSAGSGGAISRISFTTFLRFFSINLLLAPLWEECGWRGCLVPVLSRRFGIGKAALVIGLIWAAWHLPLYLLVMQTTVGSYFLACLSFVLLSFVLARLYVASGSNLVPVVLFHAGWNAAINAVAVAQPNYDLIPILTEPGCLFLAAVAAWFWLKPKADITVNA